MYIYILKLVLGHYSGDILDARLLVILLSHYTEIYAQLNIMCACRFEVYLTSCFYVFVFMCRFSERDESHANTDAVEHHDHNYSVQPISR